MSILDWRQRLTKAWTDCRTNRRVWTCEHGVYVEVKHSHVEGFAGALTAALEQQPGVAWARVNAMLGRVVVRFSGEPLASDRLVEVVDAVEREHERETAVGGVGRRGFPGDSEPVLRCAMEMGTDAGALVLGLASRVLRVKSGKVGLTVAGVTSLFEHVPHWRARVEQRFGSDRAELGLHRASALSHVLVQGMTGPMVNVAVRVLRIREHVACGEAWAAAEGTLGGEPDCHDCEAPAIDERPGPAPRGPIERYTSQALTAMTSAFGFSFVASRNLVGATGAVFGILPKPAWAGREAFAAELARSFARHGMVVMDPQTLRGLDRLDVIVVPASSLRPRIVRVEGIVAVHGFNERDARRNVMRMLDMTDVTSVHEDGSWRLGPIDELRRARPVSASAELEQQIAALGEAGAMVLGLEHHGQVVALVSLSPMPDPAIEGFVTAVRRAKLMLVCAGELDERQRWFEPDRTVPAGDRLLDSIRTLQREGHGVCLISEEPSPALAAADLGVGLCQQRAHWGAAMICAGSFATAETVIEAIRTAKLASEQSVYLARIGAASGLILSVGGIRVRTVRRVMLAANATALLAMANGVRLARSVPLAHARPTGDVTPWHALEVDQVLERLQSSREGLRPELASERRRPPVAQVRPWTRFAELMVDEFVSPFAPVLVAGAGLSALTGGIVDALLIAGVVGFNAALGAVQRYRTDQAISALDATEGQRARVLRDSRELELELHELVVGDVLVLEAGDAVPADARILEATGLELDESSLTGESLPVSKREMASFAAAVADRTSMVYEGTSIAAGRCLAVVIAVGDDTEARQASARVRQAPQTGVEARLEALTKFTAPVAALSGVALMVSGLSRGRPSSEVISSGVSLAVAAVPEGLPLLATMAQLAAARRLSKRGALVRNPRAIEALGRVNVLCADKTGTLTEGRIRLRLISDGTCEAGLEQPGEHLLAILRASLRASPTQKKDNLPDATDRALIDGAHQCGLRRRDDAKQFERLSELLFESARGYHAVHGRMRDSTDGREYVSIKGAPERVLPLCTREGPNAAVIGEARRAELIAMSEELASRGLRVLAVAERSLEARERIADRHVVDLCFRGFVAFADPVRETAKQAVDDLHKAGVGVVMITGDHPHTARAIATELGLLHAGSEGEVSSGAELELLDDAALDQRVEHTKVFARVTPAQKVRIVRSLQRRGRIVAMTGDGANDAAAIRLADVGIALGERATPAARRAADVVVTDERIETIVHAVFEGRALWRSVSDAVALLVGGNLGEIGFTLVGGLFEGRSPLAARQLLLVNLLTDTAPALAIALRRPPRIAPEELLREGPETSLGKALDRDIAWRAMVTGGATSIAWLLARVTGSRKRADTVALLTLVGSQLGQTLAIGGRDPTVLAAGLASTGLLLALVETPGISQFFGSRPVGPIALGQAVVTSVAATGVAVFGPRIWARARDAGLWRRGLTRR